MDNADLFALDNSELGHTDLVQHHVDTGDNPPIEQPVRRVPFVYRDKIAEMVANIMEKQGVIEPVVLVPKKDGQYRFCIDYRRLNSVSFRSAKWSANLPLCDSLSNVSLKALGTAIRQTLGTSGFS